MSRGELRGLFVDFYGVLTSDLFAAYRAFCTAAELPPDALLELLTGTADGHDLLTRLETGNLHQAEFEARVGERLGIDGARMIERISAYLEPETLLLNYIQQLRTAGRAHVGLISNSLGLEPFNLYGQWSLSQYVDIMVLSGEVGIRKPDPAIFAIGMQQMGLAAAQCVFVDDMPHNLIPARELGMTVVHHTVSATTIAELTHLFAEGLPVESASTGMAVRADARES